MTLDEVALQAAMGRADSAATDHLASREEDPKAEAMWTLIEPALEDRGSFQDDVREHIRESTKDIGSWRTARHGAGALALIVIAGTFVSLGWMINPLADVSPITKLGSDSVRVAFIAGSFATIFGLTALIVRGAFGNQRRDDNSGALPENLKVLIDTFGPTLRGKS